MKDKETLETSEYIGDAVYVNYDGYHVWLLTSNGYRITNKIALEPSVVERLFEWMKRNDLAKTKLK